MPTGVIHEDEAYNLWSLYKETVLMAACGLITKDEAEALREQLNTKFHEASGLMGGVIDFTDEFAEPDGMPSHWTPFKGTWGIVGNILKQTTAGVASYAHWNDPLSMNAADYLFEASVRADTNVTNNTFGVIGRYKNTARNYNFYYSKYRAMLCLDKGTASIFEKAKTLVYNQWYRFKIELVGARVRCYLDNVLEYDWVDLDSIPAGAPTLYCANPHSFDNVRIIGL